MRILSIIKGGFLYLTTYIRSVLALSIATFLLTGCQENLNLANDSDNTDTGTLSYSQIDGDPEATLVAKFEGQVKDSATGEGIANVQVSVGDAVTTTDESGHYTLLEVNTTKKAVVSFEHENYFHNSAVIQADQFSEGTDKISPNYLEYELAPYEQQNAYDSLNGTVLDLANSASISLPASAYSDGSGTEYIGEIVPQVAYLDPTTNTGKTSFPGLFEGKDSSGEMVLFGSYGLISVTLEDTDGKALDLSEGAQATLTFPALSGLEEQNIIPLWYYNYEEGMWIEEGYAELQADGTYQGTVTHLGTWSLNAPLEDAAGVYRGRIVYIDGISVKDARVTATGPNWVRSDLSTDEDGYFEVAVLPGSSFQLKAYNYKWQYEAKHSGTIPAISAGDIVEERI
jgi:hypothetical protein